MTYPSVDREMDFDTYLSDPCEEPSMTATIARRLQQVAPARLRLEVDRLNPERERRASREMDVGTAAHALITGSGDEIAVIRANDYRSKAAREDRDAARLEGKTPLLEREYDAVIAIADAFHRQIRETALARWAERLDAAWAEPSIFWREAGAHCRCRPDLLWADGIEGDPTPTALHFKTIGDVKGLDRHAVDMSWDVTWAHYGAGIEAALGAEPRQLFVAQERAAPYLLRVLDLDEAFRECGREQRSRALDTWARCVASDRWPGYAGGVETLECPAWHETQVARRSERRSERRIDVPVAVE